MTKFRLFGRQTDEVSERELSYRQLAREVAAEGMVLLKNEGVLPLQNKKIALFGAGARMTVKGGTGSGRMQGLRLLPPGGWIVLTQPSQRKKRHGG